MRTTAILTFAAGLLLPATTAQAEHRYETNAVVRSLAADVEYFAREAYIEANRTTRYNHGRGYRATLDLRALDREARHFHRQVSRYYQDPLHTARDFERLRATFYTAHLQALPSPLLRTPGLPEALSRRLHLVRQIRWPWSRLRQEVLQEAPWQAPRPLLQAEAPPWQPLRQAPRQARRAPEVRQAWSRQTPRLRQARRARPRWQAQGQGALRPRRRPSGRSRR